MSSCDETMFGVCNVDDPCPCCEGLYVGENHVDASQDEEMCEEIGVVSQIWLMYCAQKLERGQRLKCQMSKWEMIFGTCI